MQRAFLVLTLGLYGFLAMDLSGWARVPQVLLHLLEHHGHHHHHGEEPEEHGHTDATGHNPFGTEGKATNGTPAIEFLSSPPRAWAMVGPVRMAVRTPAALGRAQAAHGGAKWNPPKWG